MREIAPSVRCCEDPVSAPGPQGTLCRNRSRPADLRPLSLHGSDAASVALALTPSSGFSGCPDRPGIPVSREPSRNSGSPEFPEARSPEASEIPFRTSGRFRFPVSRLKLVADSPETAVARSFPSLISDASKLSGFPELPKTRFESLRACVLLSSRGRLLFRCSESCHKTHPRQRVFLCANHVLCVHYKVAIFHAIRTPSPHRNGFICRRRALHKPRKSPRLA